MTVPNKAVYELIMSYLSSVLKLVIKVHELQVTTYHEWSGRILIAKWDYRNNGFVNRNFFIVATMPIEVVIFFELTEFFELLDFLVRSFEGAQETQCTDRVKNYQDINGSESFRTRVGYGFKRDTKYTVQDIQSLWQMPGQKMCLKGQEWRFWFPQLMHCERPLFFLDLWLEQYSTEPELDKVLTLEEVRPRRFVIVLLLSISFEVSTHKQETEYQQ